MKRGNADPSGPGSAAAAAAADGSAPSSAQGQSKFSSKCVRVWWRLKRGERRKRKNWGGGGGGDGGYGPGEPPRDSRSSSWQQRARSQWPEDRPPCKQRFRFFSFSFLHFYGTTNPP